MNARAQRAIGVWIIAFILFLVFAPLAFLAGALLVTQPIWVLIAAGIASLLAVVEAVS